jgi:hypothetical protein
MTTEKARIILMASMLGIVSIGLVIAQGCDLRSMVGVDVPQDVKATIARGPEDVDREYTLKDIDFVVTQWKSYVELNNAYLESAIKDARERYELTSTLVNMGITLGSETASTLPGGAIIVSGLSLLTGLFLKRPGEDKRVSKEKEDSYNAGLEEGRRIAAAVKEALTDKPKDPTA